MATIVPITNIENGPPNSATATSVPVPSSVVPSQSSSVAPIDPSSSTGPNSETQSSILIEEPRSSSVPVEEPRSSSVPVEEPRSSSVPVEEPRSSSVPVEEPRSSSVPVEEPQSSSVPEEPRPTSTSPPEEHTSIWVPPEEPSPSSVPEEEPSPSWVPDEPITTTILHRVTITATDGGVNSEFTVTVTRTSTLSLDDFNNTPTDNPQPDDNGDDSGKDDIVTYTITDGSVVTFTLPPPTITLDPTRSKTGIEDGQNNPTSTSSSSNRSSSARTPSPAVIAAVSLAGLLAVLIFAFVIIFLRRRRKKKIEERELSLGMDEFDPGSGGAYGHGFNPGSIRMTREPNVLQPQQQMNELQGNSGFAPAGANTRLDNPERYWSTASTLTPGYAGHGKVELPTQSQGKVELPTQSIKTGDHGEEVKPPTAELPLGNYIDGQYVHSQDGGGGYDQAYGYAYEYDNPQIRHELPSVRPAMSTPDPGMGQALGDVVTGQGDEQQYLLGVNGGYEGTVGGTAYITGGGGGGGGGAGGGGNYVETTRMRMQ